MSSHDQQPVEIQMELPLVGEHCSEESCRRLDFLPVKCDACKQIFCSNHMSYEQHGCLPARQRNVQVPVCPLCEKPVPTPRGAIPDITMSQHIENDCRPDRGQRREKVFANKCSQEGCKIREMVPVICSDCRQNFCFKHRHVADHNCTRSKRRVMNDASQSGQRPNSNRSRFMGRLTSYVQGNMSEDEALARALQRSLDDEQRRRRQTENHNRSNCLVS